MLKTQSMHACPNKYAGFIQPALFLHKQELKHIHTHSLSHTHIHTHAHMNTHKNNPSCLFHEFWEIAQFWVKKQNKTKKLGLVFTLKKWRWKE